MALPLDWLAEVLLAEGLKVAEVDGWRTRSAGSMGPVVGVICHHTAGLPSGNMPSLETLVHGRPDLSGPLAQLGLGRDGTFYVIAAGRANHAGEGRWQGITRGNSSFIGIEAENTGLEDDSPWPAVQMEAYHRGVAAILKKLQRGVEMCAGHKEWALPKGRKSDPLFDMDEFRSAVADVINGVAPAMTMIPAAEPPETPGGPPGRPTLRRGDQGALVADVQATLRVSPQSGIFGPITEAAVRRFQRERGLTPDGIVGPNTWKELGN